MLLLISSLFFISLSALAIQKTYRKNASDFYLGKQELQASLEFSSKNFNNNGLYLNLRCATTNHYFYSSPVFAVLKCIYKYRQAGDLDFILSCCSFIIFFTFLVSVVVGVVHKDLHEVLITDQPFRTATGTTRWGYPLKFLNQIPLPSKIYRKRNSRGWTYKVVNFSKPCWRIISHMNQWSFPRSVN